MASFRIAGAWIDIVPQIRVTGLKVRTLCQLRNAYNVLPAGTVCTIKSVQAGGVNLDGPGCGHCGVKVHIRRVNRADIELLEEPKARA